MPTLVDKIISTKTKKEKLEERERPVGEIKGAVPSCCCVVSYSKQLPAPSAHQITRIPFNV